MADESPDQMFFSRLAATQRKRTTGECLVEAYPAEEADDELLKEELARLEEKKREGKVQEVLSQIAVNHQILYENRDICSLFKAGALMQFTVKELTAVCDYFELPCKSGDRKLTLFATSTTW